MYVHANDCCGWLVRWLSGSVTRLRLMLGSSTDGWAMNHYTGRGTCYAAMSIRYTGKNREGRIRINVCIIVRGKFSFPETHRLRIYYVRMLMEFSYLLRSGTPTSLISIIHTNIPILYTNIYLYTTRSTKERLYVLQKASKHNHFSFAFVYIL